MRVLGIGSYNDFGSLYLRLIGEGHEVRVCIEDENAQDILAGMVTLEPNLERVAAYQLADKIVIPNVRYRTDIGVALRDRDYDALANMTWLPTRSSAR